MKIERLDEYITTAVAVIVGVLVAYWSGLLLGSGRLGTIMLIVGGSIFTALIISLREQVWMLVPICWMLIGQVPDLPLTPSLRDVIVLSTAGAIFVLIAFKVVRNRAKVQFLDILIYGHLLYLATVFFRNPVGGLILNSEKIGGRPYLNVFIATVAYWVLARAALPNGRQADAFLTAYVWVRYSHGLLSVAANYSIGLANFVFRFYTGIDVSAYAASSLGSAPDTGRRGYMQQIGEPMVRKAISLYRPIDLVNPFLGLMQPVWLLRSAALAAGFFMVGLGGFRSSMIMLLAFLMINTWLRGGWRDTVKLMLWMSAALFTVVALHSVGVIRLPLSMQRALTFLPVGRWDPIATREANTSSRWRFEMWRTMLSSNRYIENRLLGDGFGFSMRQFVMMQALQRQGGEAGQQETYMIVGQVHSGPVSAIRYVGFVGCAFFLYIIFYMAWMAYKLVRRTTGTPYQTVTLFLAVPILYEPFNFIVVFGSYDYSLPEAIVSAGLLKMMRNTIDRHEALEVSASDAPERAEPLRPQRKYAPIRRPALARGAEPA